MGLTSIQNPSDVVLRRLVPPFSHDPIPQQRQPLISPLERPLRLPPNLMVPIPSFSDHLVERDGGRTRFRSVLRVRTEFGEVVEGLEGVGDPVGVLADRELEVRCREGVISDACISLLSHYNVEEERGTHQSGTCQG